MQLRCHHESLADAFHRWILLRHTIYPPSSEVEMLKGGQAGSSGWLAKFIHIGIYVKERIVVRLSKLLLLFLASDSAYLRSASCSRRRRSPWSPYPRCSKEIWGNRCRNLIQLRAISHCVCWWRGCIDDLEEWWWRSQVCGLLLIAETVVYLVDAALANVSSVDCFCVVIRDPGRLWGFCDGATFSVNQSDQVQPLLVGYLHILTDHSIEEDLLSFEEHLLLR